MVNDLEFGAEIILFLLVLLCVGVHVVLRQGILLITATETKLGHPCWPRTQDSPSWALGGSTAAVALSQEGPEHLRPV